MGMIFGFLGWTKEDYIEAAKKLGKMLLNFGKIILGFVLLYMMLFTIAYFG